MEVALPQALQSFLFRSITTRHWEWTQVPQGLFRLESSFGTDLGLFCCLLFSVSAIVSRKRRDEEGEYEVMEGYGVGVLS